MTMTRNPLTMIPSQALALALAFVWGLSLPAIVAAEHADEDPAQPPDVDGCEAACAGHGEAERHAEEAHEHNEHEGEDDEHEGGDDEHEGEHDEAEDAGLRLSSEYRERFGIVVETAGPGRLQNELRLSGEVVFNEDRVVHLVPRVGGIAVKIRKTLGDSVRAGEPLAVIDSSDLASAKLEYFAAVTEVGCCQFEFPRAQAIHDNVVKMLALLETSPSVEQLQDGASGEMGEYRSRLISAYAEYVLTRDTYAREQKLAAKKISSEGDFLAAENAFRTAQAVYFGTRDSVAFEVRQNLLEVTRDRQLAELVAETGKQKLHMLGLSDAAVSALSGSPQATEKAAGAKPHVCTDPNCRTCRASKPTAAEPDAAALTLPQTSLGMYEIVAPSDGVIVQKHITRGERVGEDTGIFTIVDIGNVWVNLTVYAKDLAAVRKGQPVVLHGDHGAVQARGEVAMVTPFVEASTRSATARIVLDNSDGRWIPGTFVTGFVATSEEGVAVVVPRGAVQRIEGRDVVFVDHEGEFEMTPVTVGRTDREHVEILAGLEPGTPYVAAGAFQLKATVITSNLGSHAGHGH